MRFKARALLAYGFLLFGITNASVIGGLLIWTQKLKFIDFGAYVQLGGEDAPLIIVATIFILIDFFIAFLGVYFMKHVID